MLVEQAYKHSLRQCLDQLLLTTFSSLCLTLPATGTEIRHRINFLFPGAGEGEIKKEKLNLNYVSLQIEIEVNYRLSVSGMFNLNGW